MEPVVDNTLYVIQLAEGYRSSVNFD